MLSENQANMSVELLNGKLNVRSALKQYGNRADKIPITPELLKKANAANSAYKAYLIEQKEAEERAKKESEELKRLREEEAEQKQKIENDKKSLLALENELKSKKVRLAEKRKTYAETLSLGSKKLKRALEKKGMVAAVSAQAIIQGAENLKTEENALTEETASLDKKNSKLKDKLIKKLV